MEVSRCERGAPRPLLIFSPQAAGNYPVVVFQHGFMSRNSHYSMMLERVAGHGFVVVAPQMYEPGPLVLAGIPTAAQEAEIAAEILAWLPGRLDALTGVHACTERIGLCGHSRGGKVAWQVLVNQPGIVQAVAGIDPVDGAGGPLGNQRRVIDGPFRFSLPALVIGAGLSGACAPEGDNHVQFYAASASPAWHVVVPGQGHTDMLDETAQTDLIRRVCPEGGASEPMRRLTAGLLVALFRASLQGYDDAYADLNAPASAPIPIIVEFR